MHDGKRYAYTVRWLTDADTGGPVQRIEPAGKVNVIASERSSMPPARIETHAAISRIDSYEVTLRST